MRGKTQQQIIVIHLGLASYARDAWPAALQACPPFNGGPTAQFALCARAWSRRFAGVRSVEPCRPTCAAHRWRAGACRRGACQAAAGVGCRTCRTP